MLLRPTRSQAVAVTVALTGAAVLSLGSPAEAAGGGYFAGATSSLRAAHGLPAYRTCPDLDAIANRWAATMAARHGLAHNPSLADQMAGWSSLGENVGEAASSAGVESALEHSPEHLANLESRSYTEAGYGVVTSRDGLLWVDEVFRRPGGAGCSSGSVRPAPPASRPAPAPAPTAAATASRGSTRTSLPGSRSTAPGAVRLPLPVASTPTDQAAGVARALGQLHAAAQVRSMDGVVQARLHAGGPPAQDVVAAALSFARMMRPVG